MNANTKEYFPNSTSPSWRVIKINNKKDKTLSITWENNNNPVFSDDGNHIAFSSNRQGKSGIWLYFLQSKEQEKLLTVPGVDIFMPNWSDDGKKLLRMQGFPARPCGAGGVGGGSRWDGGSAIARSSLPKMKRKISHYSLTGWSRQRSQISPKATPTRGLPWTVLAQ